MGIKVLVIVCQLNRGGLESRLMDIVRKIDYEKVCLDIYTYRMEKGTYDDEVEQLGGTIYYNPPLTPKNMFWYVGYFRDFLEIHSEYKIIHAHQDAWCSVFCKGAYLAGVPVRIAHSRTAINKFTIESFVKNIIRLPTRRYATHYFAVSILAGQWLFGKKNIQNGKVEIWKNAINCQNFRYNSNIREQVREKLGLQEKKVILHVGNFNPFKNQIFLVDVLEEVRMLYDEAVLVFVGREGSCKLMDKIKGRIKAKALDNQVIFLGERSDISEILQMADVFCFPSLFEGLPGAVLEAQAAGLPCVISSAITREVCILDTTIILDLEKPVAMWARAVLECFSKERRDTYELMAQAGFDVGELVIHLTEFYESVGKTNVI